MKEEKLLELWQRHELACFAFEYFFLYGEKWVSKHMTWLRWQFEREWKRKSEKEKQDRFNRFCELLRRKNGDFCSLTADHPACWDTIVHEMEEKKDGN